VVIKIHAAVADGDGDTILDYLVFAWVGGGASALVNGGIEGDNVLSIEAAYNHCQGNEQKCA
jgi:hypothetical protein